MRRRWCGRGLGLCLSTSRGLRRRLRFPQFPFIQNVAQKTGDSVNCGVYVVEGAVCGADSADSGRGAGPDVYTVTRTLGSGYVQQWNLAVQRAVTSNLSFDIAYVGSHIVRVGLPDMNLNQLTEAQLTQGSTALQAPVTNPYFRADSFFFVDWWKDDVRWRSRSNRIRDF